MARIGYSPRKTIAYLYGWTLVLAALALALRFVPYTDNHGHFDALWTGVMAVCLLAAGVASFRLLAALEILKLLRLRNSQWRRRLGLAQIAEAPVEPEVEEGVLRELDTGTFAAVDPATGEFRAVDPDTGEFESAPAPSDGPPGQSTGTAGAKPRR
jgi:UDP-GlcNAc:undecaprenyl-phosphate GlcNAc-1-phosphate transferase